MHALMYMNFSHTLLLRDKRDPHPRLLISLGWEETITMKDGDRLKWGLKSKH